MANDRPSHSEHPSIRPPARLIVDAMNVIGSRPTGWWRDRPGAVRNLAARLRTYAEHRGVSVTMVIDGRPLPQLAEGLHGALEVRYARHAGPNAADDRIVELLGERDECTVVTADRELRRRAEALGASTMGPNDLLRDLDRLDDVHK